jgi:hypothetical protein
MEAVFVVAFIATMTMIVMSDLPPCARGDGRLSIYEQAAPELGLTQRKGRFARAWEDLFELELSAVPERPQTGDRVTLELRLFRPIATEFSVVSRSGQRKTDLPVSFDFDTRFGLSSPRPERARRLLRGGLANALIAADVGGFVVELDHRQLTLVGRWLTQAAEITAICRCAEGLARQLIAAEAALPRLLPWGQLSRAWQAAAELLEARFDAEAHAIELHTGVGRLWLHAATLREEHWFAELELQLERPLPARFELSSEAARSLWQRLTIKDMELGDPEFDRTFFIATDQPEVVRELLDAEARSALVELGRRVATISVSSSGIRGRIDGAAVVDFELLAGIARATTTAAEALVRASRPEARGAYR